MRRPNFSSLLFEYLMRRLIIASIITGLVVLAHTQGVIILNRGCKQFNSAGDCASCSTRYYKDKEGICQPVNSNCNTYNPANGACTTCYSGFVQIEDTCLPEALFPNIAPVTDPYCNKFEGSKCVKCAFGYFFNAEGKCKQADPNCRSFNEANGECLTCYPGFLLEKKVCIVEPPGGVLENCNKIQNGQCVTCSFGYYFGPDRKCKKIPDTCLDFNTDAEKCLACYSGYALDKNNQCVKSAAQKSDPGCNTFQNGICIKCSVGYYFDSENRCKQIPPTCGDFNTILGICRNCYPGYQLNENGQCRAVDAGAGDTGCSEFKNGICVKCSFGFYFNPKGSCSQIPSTCADFDTSSEVCSQCYPGYQLNQKKQCEESKAQDGCNQFEQGVCVKCSVGFYFNPKNICTQIPVTCSNFDTKKEVCNGCYSGYKLDDKNKCVKEEFGAIDPGCAEFKNGLCVKCSFGFYFGAKGCKLIPATCSNFNTASQKCQACYPGYELDQNAKCVESVPGQGDPGCSEFKNGLCVKCSFGFYFGAAGKCKIIPPTCSNFDTAKQICNDCYPGYALNPQSQCVEAAAEQGDPGCSEFKNGLCVKCSFGFYFGPAGKCNIIPPTCSSFNIQLERCEACYPGYALDGFGVCVKQDQADIDPYCKQFKDNKCVECSVGAYFNANQVCVLADPSCKNFDTKSSRCIECYIGYAVENGKCVKSNAESGDPFCKTFKNGACEECSFRYYKNPSGKCTEVSPSCKSYIIESGKCTDCYIGFKIQGNTCVEDDAVLTDANCAQWKDGICLKCSTGSFYNIATGLCRRVDPLCKTFNPSNGFCTTCYPAFKLSEGKCLEDLYFEDQDPNCAEFTDGLCVKCSSGFFFGNQGTCQQANPLCETFDQRNGNCLTCFLGFVLKGGKCEEDQGELADFNCAEFSNNQCVRCSTGYFFNTDKKCRASNPLCKQFQSKSGACTECYVGFYLEKGDCLIDENFDLGDSLCAEWKDGVCLKCASRAFFNKAGQCKAVSEDCRTFDVLDGSCQSCYPGFKLDGATCVKAPAGDGEGCAEYDSNGKCLKCAVRRYLDNNKCVQIDDLCAQFDYNTKECIGCYSGYSILNKKCEITKVQAGKQIQNCFAYTAEGSCLECFDRFYVKDNICVEVSVFCKKSDKQNGKCTDCYTGFILKEGQCLRA